MADPDPDDGGPEAPDEPGGGGGGNGTSIRVSTNVAMGQAAQRVRVEGVRTESS